MVKPPVETAVSDATEQERNKDVIRRILDAADRGDIGSIAACYAHDYRDHATKAGSRRTGDRRGALEAFQELRAAFPDARHTILDLIAEGDKVALRVAATATHQAGFRGKAASGRSVSMTTTVVYRLRAGLIVERWLDGAESVADQLHAMGTEHVGVLLKHFDRPDETRDMAKGRFEIVRVGATTLGRATYAPGWKWSEHVGPGLGQRLCPVEHVGLVLSGTAAVAFRDGAVRELTPGTMFYIPPEPHDSWVVGDEPYVSLHLLGAEHYAK